MREVLFPMAVSTSIFYLLLYGRALPQFPGHLQEQEWTFCHAEQLKNLCHISTSIESCLPIPVGVNNCHVPDNEGIYFVQINSDLLAIDGKKLCALESTAIANAARPVV